MMTAVRQTVTVQPGGRLEIFAPELATGTVTEVIVLVPSKSPDIAERLAALHRLQDEMELTAQDVERWKEDVRLERLAWPRPADPQDPAESPT
jgi:hypothetical protein